VNHRELIEDMEQFAAASTYWDLPRLPARRRLFRRDPRIEVYLSTSKSFLDAITMNREQMIKDHPQSAGLHPAAVKLDVEALLLVKAARLALNDKRPTKAKNLFRQAKAIREQASSANPFEPLDGRSRGGRVTAAKRGAYLAFIDVEIAKIIASKKFSKGQLKGHAALAAALEEDVVYCLLRNAAALAPSLRIKIQLDPSGRGNPIPSEAGRKYAFGLVFRLLKPSSGEGEPSRVRKAYEGLIR
jgi:hypothetical protein